MTFLKELIKQANQKSALFVIIGVFVNKDFKLQPNAYNRCHDLLMISMKLCDINILAKLVKMRP